MLPAIKDVPNNEQQFNGLFDRLEKTLAKSLYNAFIKNFRINDQLTFENAKERFMSKLSTASLVITFLLSICAAAAALSLAVSGVAGTATWLIDSIANLITGILDTAFFLSSKALIVAVPAAIVANVGPFIEYRIACSKKPTSNNQPTHQLLLKDKDITDHWPEDLNKTGRRPSCENVAILECVAEESEDDNEECNGWTVLMDASRYAKNKIGPG